MCWNPVEFRRVDVGERVRPGHTREAGPRSEERGLASVEHPHTILAHRDPGAPGCGEPRETIISSTACLIAIEMEGATKMSTSVRRSHPAPTR